ncbi:polyprenyl synthetase family protein [Candidatus Roizmanbacteria bacterium]|nr:polyprenyl synthetase family protein [Candidatus Roizmanbacteria bacterium]
MKHLKVFKKEFDTALHSYLDGKSQFFNKTVPHGGEMIECIQEFIRYGGKRFRPALFHYAYESFSKTNDLNSIQFSFIFELFQSFVLIHDDIIDHAKLRRGNPTIHAKYGMEMGILAGDFALTLADELFMDIIYASNFSQSIKKPSINLYNQYKQELLIGQYLDSKHLGSPEKIMLLKTAQYSFARPVVFGLLLASVSKEIIKKWEAWMTKAGITFQLMDDYEGVMGNESKTGKSVSSDTEEGKNTLIVELFKKKANKRELDRFHSFFGKHSMTKEDVNWYKNKIQEKLIDIEIKSRISSSCKELLQELHTTLGAHTDLHILAQEILDHIQMI